VTDQKRKDVKTSAKKKNFWQTFSVRVRNHCKFLKEWQKKKTEGAEYHNPVLTSIKIIAQTVNAVPSQYNCRKTSENLSAGCANGRKALHEQNQTRASGFPFHNFSSSSVGY